jgi:flagellar hook-basal body complex protein FliE
MKITPYMLQSTNSMPQYNSNIKENALGLSEQPKPSSFENVLNQINQSQVNASQKISAVDTGQSDDMVGAIIASQKASLAFSALMQVRNKVVSGVNEVLKMPL